MKDYIYCCPKISLSKISSFFFLDRGIPLERLSTSDDKKGSISLIIIELISASCFSIRYELKSGWLQISEWWFRNLLRQTRIFALYDEFNSHQFTAPSFRDSLVVQTRVLEYLLRVTSISLSSLIQLNAWVSVSLAVKLPSSCS